MSYNGNPRKNSEGYDDPTAYFGTKKVVKKDREVEKAYKRAMHLMLSIADVAGFEVTGRIQLTHKETGKTFY